MFWKYATLACLVIFFALTGCSSQGTVKHSIGTDKIVGKSPILPWDELSAGDQTFFKALQKSVDDVHAKVTELEAMLQEMQGQDESHEAEEMMTEAKEDVLYYWNHIHNDYKPEHPLLQKMKEDYEKLLTGYRNGITMELEGMEIGDPEKLKLGYQTTKQAVVEIQKFKQQMDQAIPDSKR